MFPFISEYLYNAESFTKCRKSSQLQAIPFPVPTLYCVLFLIKYLWKLHRWQYTVVIHNTTWSALRCSWKTERSYLWVLPWTIPGHHLHHQDQAENSLLLFQLDRALSLDLLHGGPRLHSSSGLWREVITRYKFPTELGNNKINLECWNPCLLVFISIQFLSKLNLFLYIFNFPAKCVLTVVRRTLSAPLFCY